METAAEIATETDPVILTGYKLIDKAAWVSKYVGQPPYRARARARARA
eukprot:CAMPEP_0185157670 /NCGR_PEP_ID=MMETSP1139-20130426/1918_1 /TAXON_ID=298111 /ORGANISM="Pavlova sp., Strain CCMP459" /LENGTH=47 /DNA_ID= /DNA_START= /DNA_END= /DNA_ORIENTATION=